MNYTTNKTYHKKIYAFNTKFEYDNSSHKGQHI